MLVVAEVDETLVPVFSHSFQHSLVSALEANGIEALIGPSLVSGEPIEADAVLRVTVKPLYRMHQDGYEALVGTVFEATQADTATGDDAWRLSGTVDYIGDQFFKQHGFRVHEGILKEFAWNTTAAIVRTFGVTIGSRCTGRCRADQAPVRISGHNRSRGWISRSFAAAGWCHAC